MCTRAREVADDGWDHARADGASPTKKVSSHSEAAGARAAGIIFFLNQDTRVIPSRQTDTTSDPPPATSRPSCSPHAPSPPFRCWQQGVSSHRKLDREVASRPERSLRSFIKTINLARIVYLLPRSRFQNSTTSSRLSRVRTREKIAARVSSARSNSTPSSILSTLRPSARLQWSKKLH